MTNSIIVKTSGLRHEYGSAAALDGLDLEVAQGAVFALVGPNGAGKTTLLKILAGLIEPTSGVVVVDGIDIQLHPREAQTRHGFLPDFFGLYEDLTVEEYLEFYARAYRIPEAAADFRIGETLGRVGLEDRRNSGIKTLSRGMRQRLGVARALIHDPPLLLLDEPASGLDPGARRGLQELFKSLAADGKTLIVSSHILSELEDYCSHVAILRKGELVAVGEVDAIRRARDRRREVVLRVLDGQAAAAEMLEKNGSVAGLSVNGREITFGLLGGDAALAEILKGLVSGGVQVVHFGEKGGKIEDSYLSWVGGEDS